MPLNKVVRRMRTSVAQILLRGAFRTLNRGRTYQPVQLGVHHGSGTREFEARWRPIAEVISRYEPTNLLDVGCAEGWLLRRVATEFGCFAVGIEAGDRILIGEVSRLHDHVERMAVMRAFVTAEDIRRLPRFDIVICLSVVHHIIKRDGVINAQEFVRALASRAKKAFIFEMGTSDEKQYAFASQLPEMPKGQESFISDFLHSCGLTSIKVIGKTEKYSGTVRLLFCAEPSSYA